MNRSDLPRAQAWHAAAALVFISCVPGGPGRCFGESGPGELGAETHATARPRIPEPLVFDLIRPLGSERGELEANSLFRFSPGDTPRRLLWAPEVEYEFLDGYGVEFELPLENARVDSYKGAIQGTLPGPWRSKFIHGWQALAEVSRKGGYYRTDLLYLAGARWHDDWSVFTMTGVERESAGRSAYAFLGNYSLFYHLRDSVSYGLESNFKGRGISGRGVLLMPQLQWKRGQINMQVGTGWRWQGGTNGLQFGWRLSREF